MGSTKDLAYREATHFYNLRRGKHANRHLQGAYQKYGSANFTFHILDSLPENALILRENEYLASYVGESYCYNLAKDAVAPMRGRKGTPHTPESKAKISAANKGSVRSAAYRAKISASRKGQRIADETKIKISAALKGKPKPPRSRAHGSKIAAANLGRKHTLASRANMSAAKKRYDATRALVALILAATPPPLRLRQCLDGTFRPPLALAEARFAQKAE